MEEVKYKCSYVREWSCYVENEELSLEICRLCLDAKLVRLIETLIFYA